jgi:hypothetical protein
LLDVIWIVVSAVKISTDLSHFMCMKVQLKYISSTSKSILINSTVDVYIAVTIGNVLLPMCVSIMNALFVLKHKPVTCDTGCDSSE